MAVRFGFWHHQHLFKPIYLKQIYCLFSCFGRFELQWVFWQFPFFNEPFLLDKPVITHLQCESTTIITVATVSVQG